MAPRNDDLAVLQKWLAMPDRISDRAQMVILSASGADALDIAKRLGVSPRSVNEWLNRYAKQGLSGLVDEQRRGRGVTDKKLKAIARFLIKTAVNQQSESLESFSRRINRSPDTIWRAGRRFGLTPTKNLRRDVLASIDPDTAASGLVGLFLTDDLLIAAFLDGLPWMTTIPLWGLWMYAPTQLLKATRNKHGEILHFSLEQAIATSALNDRVLHPRAQHEAWQRWINTIGYAEPMMAPSIRFLISGNVSDPRVFKTLRLCHDFKHRTKSVKSNADSLPAFKVQVLVDRQDWLQAVSGEVSKSSDFPFSLCAKPWIIDNGKGGGLVWCRTPIEPSLSTIRLGVR